jgi:hypothetical protein
MPLHDKEILEALSSSRILASMITPAVLISACGTLIFSTSARLGRIYDRLSALKGEVEAIADNRLSEPEERIPHLRDQLQRQRTRAWLIQKSLSALYTATALFIAASLGIAFNAAFGSEGSAWIPTAIALLGGLFLFAASALLMYESRHNLTFVYRHIEFIGFLLDRSEATRRKD